LVFVQTDQTNAGLFCLSMTTLRSKISSWAPTQRVCWVARNASFWQRSVY